MTSTEMRVGTAKELYERWINELWAGQPVVDDLVSEDFVGHLSLIHISEPTRPY